METTKMDKRVIKTKSAIRGALNQLVQQKDMCDISISELVAKANITRSTFYVYYDSIAAVRDDIENEIIAQIDKVMNENDWLKSMVNPYPLLSAIAAQIAKYDEYNRYILSSNNSGSLLDKINSRAVDAFIAFATQTDIGIDVAKAKYVAAFTAAGISECFKLWYNHKSSLTLEELCLRISEFVTKGMEIFNNFN